MQDVEEDSPVVSTGELIAYQTAEYFLQPFDIVDITITTRDEELNALFSPFTNNNQNMGMMGGGGQAGGDAFFMNGYTLDDKGFVELPLIGEIELIGLTTEQAQTVIEKEVSKYVKEGEFFIRVRLGGIRFSALGEFNSPGKITILQNRVTIFEAIAAARDLSILAKRDEIVLVRQYPTGSQIHRINLNDKALLGSEFYFIRPNDLIYAEPLKVREIGNTTNFIQSLTLLTTTITAIALILTLISNSN
ncbi:sugar transporter [Algoriphagus kandeliae]|uniref:Sugar transporter n=2 Tax=Algoriphagus kandeliae TaxID=2562278 RepID=A0A4Y9QZA6_9BACT|nr:sugar transporter [Algoriphagus kandeliae]